MLDIVQIQQESSVVLGEGERQVRECNRKERSKRS